MQYGYQDIEYKNKPIPGIRMGDGTTGVCASEKNDDGFTAICFFPAPENREIGAVVHEEYCGVAFDKLPIDFHILFNNPDSIDVVIGFLEEAKGNLKENNVGITTRQSKSRTSRRMG